MLENRTDEPKMSELDLDALESVAGGSKIDDVITLAGTVVESLPNAMYTVDVGGRTLLAHLSGKMRMNFVKVKVGDSVTIEQSPYDKTRGRITYRT